MGKNKHITLSCYPIKSLDIFVKLCFNLNYRLSLHESCKIYVNGTADDSYLYIVNLKIVIQNCCTCKLIIYPCHFMDI